jgi:glycosyltransferase involved in cell wall biosynthesis
MYSVVIPSLGRVKYLNELILSIFAQTVQPLEIFILLDDNSHCRSIEHEINLGELAKLVWCKHLNLAEKRNHGASLIQSDFLLFSDDDDIWDPLRAENVLAALKFSHVCCHNFGKFGALSECSSSKLGIIDMAVSTRHLFYGANVFGGGSAISVKKGLVEFFPFSENYRYCEDFEWWLRVISAGIKVSYLGKSLVYYRIHDSNMTNSIYKITRYNFQLGIINLSKGLQILLIAVIILSRSLLRFPVSPVKNFLVNMRK